MAHQALASQRPERNLRPPGDKRPTSEDTEPLDLVVHGAAHIQGVVQAVEEIAEDERKEWEAHAVRECAHGADCHQERVRPVGVAEHRRKREQIEGLREPTGRRAAVARLIRRRPLPRLPRLSSLHIRCP